MRYNLAETSSSQRGVLLDPRHGRRQRVPCRIKFGDPVLNAAEVRLPLGIEQRRRGALLSGDLFRQIPSVLLLPTLILNRRPL
jgi:hypothetical protein